jgi:hypothetical protein
MRAAAGSRFEVPTHAEVAKSFWTRSARHWTDVEKLLGLYVLSGPHSTSEGYYRLPLGYVVDDLGWKLERVNVTMDSLSGREFVRYDDDAQVVFVCKRLEYRQPRGEKQVRGAVNVIRDVPPSPLLALFLAAAEQHAGEFHVALLEEFPDGGNTGPQPVAIPLTTPICRAGDRAPGLSPTPTPTPNGLVSPDGLDAAQDRLKAGSVRRVFDAWIEAAGKTGATQLDSKRRSYIEKALKAFSEEDVIDAVRGWRHDPHNRGENDRGRAFNGLHVVLRDAEQIERFRDLERASTDDTTAAFVARVNARGAA